MLGKYDNFPDNIHRVDGFDSTLPNKQLQQKMIQALCNLNKKQFDFEEIAIPTIPNCQVFFEFGLAEDNGFSFLDEQETKKILDILKTEAFETMDVFCAIRYYKLKGEEKIPLKFDYYMIRVIFGLGKVEFQVSHQRGPRYLSPEDLTNVLAEKINENSHKKPLRKVEAP